MSAAACDDGAVQSDAHVGEELLLVEGLRGRDGLLALRAKAAELGIRSREKEGDKWKMLPMEVLRARLLDRLRGEAAAVAAQSHGSSSQARLEHNMQQGEREKYEAQGDHDGQVFYDNRATEVHRTG